MRGEHGTITPVAELIEPEYGDCETVHAWWEVPRGGQPLVVLITSFTDEENDVRLPPAIDLRPDLETLELTAAEARSLAAAFAAAADRLDELGRADRGRS